MGNDIVDLAAPGNRGKSGDERFLGRVFTGEERNLIAAAERPDGLLWAIWASKEAAYKAISRDDPSVGSIPRRYLVVPEKGRTAGADACLCGKVITPKGALAIRVTLEEDRVHALAAGSESTLDRLCWQVEETGVASDSSALIRDRLLQAIAHILDCAAGELSVFTGSGRFGAPRIHFRGRPLRTEFSLSHDGRFAAFAFDPATLPAPACEAPCLQEHGPPEDHGRG